MVTGFSVNTTDDNVFEDDETFKLAIDTRTLPSQVTVNGDRTTVVTIVDNEGGKNQCNITVIYCV